MTKVSKVKFYQLITGYLITILFFSFVPATQLVQQIALIALCLVTIYLISQFRLSPIDLGMVMPSTKYIIGWITITLFMVLIIFGIKWFFPMGIFTGLINNRSTLITLLPSYVIFSAFIQEFVFRGFIFGITRRLFTPYQIILVSISLFAIAHLHYYIQFRSNLIFLSIISGVFWTIGYSRYPNLWLAWISHAIVGGLGIFLLQRFY
jgi:membrane protease YdiL (CAAX protease family)